MAAECVWIVFGTMTDFHGARIMRVCTSQAMADEITKAIKAADPCYRVNYARIPLDASCTVDLT